MHAILQLKPGRGKTFEPQSMATNEKFTRDIFTVTQQMTNQTAAFIEAWDGAMLAPRTELLSE